MENIYTKTAQEHFEKFGQIWDSLMNESVDLQNQIEAEKSALEELKLKKLEYFDKINQLDEESNQIEIALKIEELNQKTCSDETKNSREFMLKELENEIDMYRQKNQIYRDEFNIDFKISKENKTVKIIFLNNDQEILLTFQDEQTVKISIEKFVDEVIESGTKPQLVKYIENFNNNTNGKAKDLTDLIHILKDIICN